MACPRHWTGRHSPLQFHDLSTGSIPCRLIDQKSLLPLPALYRGPVMPLFATFPAVAGVFGV
jgi:hypothetical protein